MLERSRFLFIPDVRSWLPKEGLVVRISEQTRTKRDLLGRFRKALQFPGYFGWNWDALDECLRDLSWLREVSHISVVHDGVPFGSRSTKLRETYLRLLDGLVQESGPGSRQWMVVFPESARASIERNI